MSFERLDTTRMPEGPPWVSIGIGRTNASAKGKPQIAIRISRSLCAFIGLGEDNFVGVEIGRDEDEGIVRIFAVEHGGLTPERKSKTSRSFRFSAYRIGVLERHDVERLPAFRVQPKIDDEGRKVIDIELPTWAGGLSFDEARERGRIL